MEENKMTKKFIIRIKDQTTPELALKEEQPVGE